MKKPIIQYFIFSILLFTAGCFNPKAYDDIKPTGIITFTTGNGTVAADGTSSFAVKVMINKNAAQGKRTVIFTTTFGSFKGGTADSVAVLADTNFVCTAKLTSMKVGMAVVTAKILGIQAINSPVITFERAYPDSIAVAVDSFAIQNNYRSEALITATLTTKNGGKPTIGQAVNFAVSDLSGNPIGTFLNNISVGTTDINGQVEIRYSAGNASYTGLLTIKATTLNSLGQTLFSTTQVYLDQ